MIKFASIGLSVALGVAALAAGNSAMAYAVPYGYSGAPYYYRGYYVHAYCPERWRGEWRREWRPEWRRDWHGEHRGEWHDRDFDRR